MAADSNRDAGSFALFRHARASSGPGYRADSPKKILFEDKSARGAKGRSRLCSAAAQRRRMAGVGRILKTKSFRRWQGKWRFFARSVLRYVSGKKRQMTPPAPKRLVLTDHHDITGGQNATQMRQLRPGAIFWTNRHGSAKLAHPVAIRPAPGRATRPRPGAFALRGVFSLTSRLAGPRDGPEQI